jgi:hypothetical protein
MIPLPLQKSCPGDSFFAFTLSPDFHLSLPLQIALTHDQQKKYPG